MSIEIETSCDFECYFYIFEKTKNMLEPYKVWDSKGFFSKQHAEKEIDIFKEDFPEVEFAIFRVTIEKEDEIQQTTP